MTEQQAGESALPVVQSNLSARLALLAALLFAEKLVLSALVDSRRARDALGMGAWVHLAQHWGFRYLVTFIAAISIFAFVRTQQTTGQRQAIEHIPYAQTSWILIHVLLLIALMPLSYFLYRGDAALLSFATMAELWVALCVSAVFAAGVGLIPLAIWLRMIRSMGIAWLYAGFLALLATSAWLGSEKLWRSAAKITFKLVTWVLLPLVPTLSTDSGTRVMSAPHFAVEVTEACSGLEGLGLTMAFSTIWLVYFRREYIFPRALILIPMSLAAIFAMNVLRIATLFLIGNAGYPEVALYGFHSQAGWIAFNAVACALVYFSRRSRWLNRTANAPNNTADVHNPTAIYLMPLLTLLAAGVLSHAMSGKFEWLYPLRFGAGLAILALYRHDLLKVDWGYSWRGPTIGLVVFLIWMASALVMLPHLGIPDALKLLSPTERGIWIVCRLLASILTVPIAEELAYRGYLMRRLGHANFESLPFRAVRWPALALSSIAFGLGHGALWLPGIVAGGIYGMLAISTGRLGEALVAHMTTNALIGCVVLTYGQWQLW